MARDLTPDEAVARARALQDDRIKAVRGVAEARQSLADVRERTAAELAALQAQIAERVKEAERRDLRAYNAARSVGWTAEELRKIGFGEPDKVARARGGAQRRDGTRAARSSRASTAPDAQPAGSSDTPAPAAAAEESGGS